ncbi:hypothetical protein [Treponema pedis]|uniref:hypothetical protein n=1 Tax=Treponema pedis TaxID=409322 RepID=UPI0003FAF2D5|nr:hypothetical protein [Treponema pedis]
MKKIIFNIFTVFAVLLFCSGCKNRNAADKFYQRPSNAAEKQQDSDSSAPPPVAPDEEQDDKEQDLPDTDTLNTITSITAESELSELLLTFTPPETFPEIDMLTFDGKDGEKAPSKFYVKTDSAFFIDKDKQNIRIRKLKEGVEVGFKSKDGKDMGTFKYKEESTGKGTTYIFEKIKK